MRRLFCRDVLQVVSAILPLSKLSKLLERLDRLDNGLYKESAISGRRVIVTSSNNSDRQIF